MEALLWLPGAAAILAGIGASYRLGKAKLCRVMGPPNWNFTQSWASNFTVAAGLLTIATLSSLIPAQPGSAPLKTTGYTALSVVFTLLATLAPMVFNFSRTVRAETQGTNPPEIASEGRAYMFVVAAILTLWGAIGQLELQVLLLDTLQRANAVPASIAVMLEVVFSLIAFGVLVYGSRMMVKLVELQPPRPPAAALAEEAEPAAEPAVRWPLL
jgi:hypothetical protein